MGQQLERAAVNSRFGLQVSLNRVIGFTTVGGTCVEDDLPLNSPGLWIPARIFIPLIT